MGIEPDDATGGEILDAAEEALDRADPGAWNQALMDLGREVCRPRPRCDACPIAGSCRSVTAFPRPPRPRRTPQESFQGSSRQIRGSVIRELAASEEANLRTLARRTRHPVRRLAEAVRALHAEGLVEAEPGALAGNRVGRVRLSETGV
jgi:A/G-specific adenine glycosylase